MNARDLVFLRLLEGELSGTVLPALSDGAAVRMATMGDVQLGRLIVEETAVPGLKAEAIAAWRGLLPALREALDAGACRRFERTLDSAAADWPALEREFGATTTRLLSGDEKAAQLAAQLVAIEARLRDGREAAWAAWKNRQTDATTSESAELSDTQVARLLDFIKQRFPRETGLRIIATKPLLGGFSKHTLFIDLAGNIELPDRLVMRRDSPYFTTGWSIRKEFPVIEAMYAAGVAVPRPYAVDVEGEVIGTPFMLLAHVAGQIIGDFLTVQPNRAAALDLARKMAKLHSVPCAGLESLVPGGGMSIREYMSADIDKYEATWNGVTQQHAGAMRAAIAWLRRNIALADAERVVVHRDIGFHNLLVHNDEIAALLDWELVTIGARADDIAYLYYVIPQMMDWEEFVSAYEAAAGIKLDRRHIDYYVVLSLVRTAASVCNLADPAFSGERPSLQVYFAGGCFGEILLQRVSSRLAEVMLA